MNECCCQFISKNWKLNCAIFRTKCLEVWCNCCNFSFAYKNTGNIKSELGWSINWLLTNSEVDSYSLIFKSTTLYDYWNSTSQLTKRWVDFCDCIAWTDNFIDCKCIHIIEPTIVPSSEDKEAWVCCIITNTSILSWCWSLWALRLYFSPQHSANVKITGWVNVGAKSAGLSFIKVSWFTTKNKIFPCWDSFNHYGRVVPTSDIVVNIRVWPFICIQIKDNKVVVLGFRVPAAIRVKFIIVGKQRMTSTTFWLRCLSNYRLELCPCFCLNIKRVDIIESDSWIVETAMTSINVDLTLVMASASISTRWWSFYSGLLVWTNNFVSKTSSPRVVWNFEPPAVIQSLRWTGVTTVDEDTIESWSSNSNVLSSCRRAVLTDWVGFFFLPTAFL